ncbi:MAG: glycosyltransferase family 39 protein [Verrucomicrobiales bacterium]|jgi:4-amino-4-deoxy-L-arabinose transferase-like glycosyltransferase|nr:glycosyltransferase family 39 protein [Verrucomicrobiales bacterium]
MTNTPHYSREGTVELRLPGGWSVPWHRAALVLIALVALWRLWYVTQLELIGDEAYYFLWSKHPDWSYYSKGPGVAAVIWLGTHLFGDSVFGIRCGSVALSAGTAYCLYRLGRKLFGGQTGFCALVLAAVTPLFAIGGVLMTIDPISVFCWAAAALAFWRAKDDASGGGWWLLTGALVGLGMLAKYTNIAQLACFAVFCALSRQHRRHLWRKNFWLMTLAALVCLTPVIVWNYQHDWITVQHLWQRGALDSEWHCSLGELWKFYTLQGIAYSPLFFMAIVSAAVAGLWRGRRDERVLYLEALFWPLFLFYSALSLHKAAEANWVVPCYLSGFILATVIWHHWLGRWKLLAGAFVTVSVLVALVMTAALTLGAWWRLPLKKDPLNRARGWASLGAQVYELQKEHGATFVIGSDYGLASLVSFYLPRQPQTYLVTTPDVDNQYSFWSDYSDGFGNQSAIYVTAGEAPETLRREFARVELLKESYTVWRGQNIKQFKFYLCREYGGAAAADGEAQ